MFNRQPSYQRANSFTANDIPISAQRNTSGSPPPTLPTHQNMPSPFAGSSSSVTVTGNDNTNNNNNSNNSNNNINHSPVPGKLANEYYPADIEMQNRSASPYPHPPQQQQPMYYNNMYPPPPPLLQQQQQQQQPIYIQSGAPVNDMYAGHPLKRALLGPVRHAIFSKLSALAMLAVMIYELVRNYQLTGSVIQTQPAFNVMIGPSFTVLINMGAKFTPCMRSLPNVTTSTLYGQCFGPADTCNLQQMCGLPSLSSVPNQAYRFVAPIFMHAGIVHFLLNMLTHLRLGVDLERALGLPRYVLLYMASGIWGFILSAMLANENTASMGCSGALFGLIGYMFVDVCVNWKILQHPWRELMSLLISTIISLVLGLLPGLDNFCHIGGFVMGLVMGILIAPPRPMASRNIQFLTWVGRILALAIAIVAFVVLIKQFYETADLSKICPNCKYLSCLPVRDWCDSQQPGV